MNRISRALVDGVKLRQRLLAAVAIAIVVLVLLPSSIELGARAAITWNAGGISYLVLSFALMSSCDTDCIRKYASIEDEARLVFFIVILLAIVASFTAVFILIGEAKAMSGWPKAWHTGLAAVTVIVSWLVMQIVFMLHYAHDYYGERDEGGIVGGLAFPGDEAPDYWDFFYFTTSIGAASQTSDVEITSKAVRRMVAFQAVLAFVFNTAIVALAINMASGLV
ncbi:MAG: DUF1345 domain-containing protein [Hyphomicrobiaceae bacterium]